MNQIVLRNGVSIPQIGLGTWQITDKETIKEIMEAAVDKGYKLVDTAAAYSNEMALGKAIQALELSREDLILSDKVWNTCRGYEAVRDACMRSMKKLKTSYLDLYLVHWPASPKLYPDWKEINADTWRGMESLYKEGLVKAIGVCNFKMHHLEELKKTAEVMPFINQVECHPGMIQEELVSYCRENQIQIEASSPLGNGQILQNECLKKIAAEKNKTTAQICMRWGIQKGFVLIPKTSNVNRLSENIDIFDFELSENEMKQIDEIPFCGGLGYDSDEVTEFG